MVRGYDNTDPDSSTSTSSSIQAAFPYPEGVLVDMKGDSLLLSYEKKRVAE